MSKRKNRGFTLLEMMAVVIVMLVLLGVAALTFANGTQAVKMKKDASQTLAYLRNMWDHAKATGAPIILSPNFREGTLSYADPRSGVLKRARFDSKARVVGIRVNDRLYSEASYAYGSNFDGTVPIHLSEGRGLTLVGVALALLEDEDDPSSPYIAIKFAQLNLITGKGAVYDLETGDYDAMLRGLREGAENEVF